MNLHYNMAASERERETEGLDAWYQTAVNLITVRNFVLRLSSLSE